MAVKEFTGELDEEYTAPRVREFTGKLDGEVEPKKGPIQADEDAPDFTRGIGNILPQIQSTYGAAKALVGVGVQKLGAEQYGKEMMQSGLQHMEEGEARTVTKPTDELTAAWEKGIGSVITDWLPYQMGAGVGNLAETLGFMGIGAIGGAGVASAPGAIAGAVSKGLIKAGIKEAAEKVLKAEGKDAAEEFVKAAAKKEITAFSRGATAGMAAQSGMHGLGEVGGRAFEEGEKRGERPEDIDLGRVLPAAAAHSIADFVADKIMLGAFKPVTKEIKNGLAVEIAKRIMATGKKELVPEEVQTLAERWGAKLSLTDAAAINDYINTAGASYAMGIIPGASGAITSHISAPVTMPAGKPGEETKLTTDPEQSVTDTELEKTQDPATKATLDKILGDEKVAPPVDETNNIPGANPAPEAIVTPPAPPAPEAIATPPVTPAGDQNAATQSDTGGTGVGAEVSGQSSGVPTGGVGESVGSGVDVTGDNSQQTQGGATLQSNPVAPVNPETAFNDWLEDKGIPLTSIQSQQQWDTLRAQWEKESGQKAPVAQTPVAQTPVAQTPVAKAQAELAEAETAVVVATTPEKKKEATTKRNKARQKLQKAQTEAPATETETKTKDSDEDKIDKKPVKYVDGYTPTAEPSASNFLNQSTFYSDPAPITVENGIQTAATYEAFDIYDSAHGAVRNALRRIVKEKSKETKLKKKLSFERPLEFMTLDDLINLYKQYAGTRKKFDAGGAPRIKAAKDRAAFVESLTPEQRKQYEKTLAEVLKREVAAEGAGRRETTEADQRKHKEKQEKNAKKQKEKVTVEVEEQVAEANMSDEEIAAKERAEQDEFIKQEGEEEAAAALATKSEEQLEKEATADAVQEAKEEKVTTVQDKRLMSAVNESGDIKSVLEEIGKNKESSVGMLARNLAKIFKYLNIADPTENRISFGKVKKGHDGMFDPKTEHITLAGRDGVYTGDRDLAETLLHEIMHYYLDHIVDNREAYLKSLPADQRAEVRAAFNRLDQNHKRAKDILGSKFNISSLKEFIAEVFSNRDFQQALIHLDKNGGSYKVGVNDSYFKTIIKNILSALGIDTSFAGGTFAQTIEDVMHLVAVPYVEGLIGKGVSYSTAPSVQKGNDILNRPPERLDVDTTAGIANKKKPLQLGNAREIVRKLQNFHAPVKYWEADHDLAKLINHVGDKINNIYTQITLAAGRGVNLYREYVSAPMERLHASFADLSKALNKSADETLEFLHVIAIMMHEPERRMVKYLRDVPLNDKAADKRDEIFKFLATGPKLSNGQVQALRAKLNDLVANNIDGLGKSPRGDKVKGITDINNPVFTVTDEFSPAELADIKAAYEAHPAKAQIDAVMGSVKELNNVTTELNRKSNFWSDPTDNYRRFYGWENYVPFKVSSRLSEDDKILDLNSTRHGADLQDRAISFDGSFKTSNNPILQVMSDAARSAARAGRTDLTLAIKNAVEQGLIPSAKKPKKIKFEDRDTALVEGKKANTIFHYNKDGTVDIITINDMKLVNGIRRTYQDSHPTIDLLNKVTGLFGKMHTRYNYAFAPMNFVRDIFTNAFTIGADMGPVQAAKFLTAVSGRVMQGGLAKAGRVAYLYESNKIAELRELAKTDPYIKDMWEYLDNGGMVSYTESLSLKNKLQDLNKGLGRNKILATADKAEQMVDIWNNMFEFASRAAAYGVIKKQMMDKQATSQEAAVRATAYVKNLANFEQVGEYGKVMGAWFMFFRPAATGAVRAIDSIIPAFQSVEKAESKLSQAILNDPKARAEFRKAYAEKQLNARIMTVALMGLGAATYWMSSMMAPDDDLGRNSVLTDNMAQWTRYARFHIPNWLTEKMGMGKDVVFQMPWGFGLGAFSAAGAQLAGAAIGKASTGEALKNIFTNIALDSFLPLPVSKMDPTESPLNWVLDSAAPSAVRPLLEFAINKDGLGRGIYNESYRKMVDAYTAGDRIPEMYKNAARYMFDATNGQVDVSPNTMYFLANSYFDGVSRIAETTTGIYDLAGGKKEFNPKTDSILFSSFFGAKANVDNKEFASIQNQMLNKEKILNAVKTNPEQYMKYMAENPMDEGLVKAFNKDINGELKKLQTQAKQIRMMPDLSPKERQSMLEPNLLMQRLIKNNFIEKYKAFDINP